MRCALFVVLVSLMALAVPVKAGHAEVHESNWFEYRYWPDHSGVIYCTALKTVDLGGGLFLHDRPGRDQPYWTGSVASGGGGTFVYLESNGVPGIQIGAKAVYSTVSTATQVRVFDDPFHYECPNADELVWASVITTRP